MCDFVADALQAWRIKIRYQQIISFILFSNGKFFIRSTQKYYFIINETLSLTDWQVKSEANCPNLVFASDITLNVQV